MRGGRLLILGHGVIGQGQLCPPARRCHAMRCLVIYYDLVKSGNDFTHIYQHVPSPIGLHLRIFLIYMVNM